MAAKAKVHTAAKPAKGAKPAAHKSTAHKARTTTAKTTAKAKSAKTSAKHTVTKKAPAKRGWARPSDLLPSCAAEAVAMSLRLAGQRVTDDEVAGLHWLAGGDASRPVSIADALAAAARFGLAGCRPDGFALAHLAGRVSDPLYLLQREDDPGGSGRPSIVLGDADLDCAGRERNDGHLVTEDVLNLVLNDGVTHALILGVDVPGPHAVLATPDGWWSWGKLYDPWPCAIEEWTAVSWS